MLLTMPISPRLSLTGLLMIVLLSPLEPAGAQDTARPLRVLITNDNGIADPKIAALAAGFVSDGAETWVVASADDRSGASNYLQSTRTGRFRVRPVDLGPGVRAFAVDGTPADCVVFALTGLLRETPPDLVVSGINGGANLADDWFGSGTIGAARTAAYFGIPAIAVSGLQSEDPSEMAAAARWVVAFARGELSAGLRAPRYLTVSFPETPLSEVRGVEITTRARGVVRGISERAGAADGWETWQISIAVTGQPAAGTDVDAVRRGNIAIVPMRVDEMDAEAMEMLRRRAELMHSWTAPAAPR
jgi:5'-nucleotidase